MDADEREREVGTATMMFTDLAGSTAMRAPFQSEWPNAVRRNRCLRRGLKATLRPLIWRRQRNFRNYASESPTLKIGIPAPRRRGIVACVSTTWKRSDSGLLSQFPRSHHHRRSTTPALAPRRARRRTDVLVWSDPPRPSSPLPAGQPATRSNRRLCFASQFAPLTRTTCRARRANSPTTPV